MKLPLQQTTDKGLSLLQTKWKSILDPVLSNPTTNLLILKNINLIMGNNQIPHLLQQVQQGWIVLDIQGVADIYRYAAFNYTYLYLNSSADVTVSLGVF